MMDEEDLQLKMAFYNVYPAFPTRPPEMIMVYPKKTNLKYKNTRTLISLPTLFNVLLLLAATMGLIWYDIQFLSAPDVVSASSLPPPILPNGVEGESNDPEKACDKSRVILRDKHGFFSSGPEFSNYTQNTHCEWLIKPTHSMDTLNDNSQSSNNYTKGNIYCFL